MGDRENSSEQVDFVKWLEEGEAGRREREREGRRVKEEEEIEEVHKLPENRSEKLKWEKVNTAQHRRNSCKRLLLICSKSQVTSKHPALVRLIR